LLDKLNDDKVFRAERGPFSNNSFDVITLGIANNIDFYENQEIDVLKNKIMTLKQGDGLLATSSIKVNAKQRNIKRIEFAKSFFAQT
jgi:hypothetical protein